MKISIGHFNIFPILQFAAEHPVMPSPHNVNLQKEYKLIIDKAIKDVTPNLPGWYLWGKFNDMGWWETIYLGKAGKKKTSSLRTRLYDELREECIAFWSSIYGREPMIKQHNRIYNSRYDPTRSIRKIGSQFVIWIAVQNTISEDEIKKQEDILIKIYRPTHNAARWNNHIQHDQLTDEIEKAVEIELEKIFS